MGCDFPIPAWRQEEVGPNGKRLLTFNPVKSVNSTNAVNLPCGRCMGCRLEKSRQWGVRMMHEAKCFDDNVFLTLTYDDEHCPKDYSLNLEHWQLFMKRLRKSQPQKLRFYACGEYGDRFGRPHYHAVVFNLSFPDKQLHDQINGNPIYTSPLLSELWGLGYASLGSVTFASACYVARYATKKITGPAAADHYLRVSPLDGKLYTVRPEFGVMSRRPGIGHSYTAEFKGDYYPSGFIVVNGVKQAPPRYYINQLTEAEQTILKRNNRRRALARKPDQTNRRRAVIAEARDLRIKALKRNLG